MKFTSPINGKSYRLNGKHYNKLIKKNYRIDSENNRVYRPSISEPKFIGNLMPHQKTGVEWMLNREFNNEGKIGFIMADDMGLGKTVQIIYHIIATYKPGRKSLIIVPKSILDQWQQEVYKYTNLGGNDIVVYYQNKREIHKDSIITITTGQTLVNDTKYKKLLAELWYRVVIDESSCIRNKTTQLCKSVFKLKYTYGICMSGTPVNNDIKDLIPQLDFCKIPPPPFMNNVKTKNWLGIARVCNQTELENWRQKYLIRRTKEVLKLPGVTTHMIELIMSPDEFEAYKTAVNRAMDAFANWYHTHNRDLNMYTGVLVQLLRMRQSCDHCNLSNMSMIHKSDDSCIMCGQYSDDMINNNNCDAHIICNDCLSKKSTGECQLCRIDPICNNNTGSTKINHLFSLYDKIPHNEKVVVFSQWTSMLDIIGKHADKLGIEYTRLDGSMSIKHRVEAQKQFYKDDSCRLFLLSLKAGSMGLNITRANHVVLVDPWWNPFIEQQAIDRVHRIGQIRPVSVYRINMKYTIEEWTTNLKQSKIEQSRLIIGKCPFTMGVTTNVNNNDMEKLFRFVNNHMDPLNKLVYGK